MMYEKKTDSTVNGRRKDSPLNPRESVSKAGNLKGSLPKEGEAQVSSHRKDDKGSVMRDEELKEQEVLGAPVAGTPWCQLVSCKGLLFLLIHKWSSDRSDTK